MTADVILLAAGSGTRFGGSLEKQFLSLDGIPLFVWSCRQFSSLSFVSRVVVVVPEKKIKAVKAIISRYHLEKKTSVVAGGTYRGQSVRNALDFAGLSSKVILVHDAARPLVTKKIIRDVYKAALAYGVALAAWPLSDTLKVSDQHGFVKKTVPRNSLWCAQTPQGFRQEIAQRILRSPSPDATDDVSLAERKRMKVKLVTASPVNLKVTYPFDLKMAVALDRL